MTDVRVPRWILLELLQPKLAEAMNEEKECRLEVGRLHQWMQSPNWSEVWKEDYDQAVRHLRAAEKRRNRLIKYVKSLK